MPENREALPRLCATYDPEARALYVRIYGADGLVRTQETDGFNVDLRPDGLIAGFEFLLPEPLEILTDPSTGNSVPYPVIEVRADVPPMPVFSDGRTPKCESKGCTDAAVSFVLHEGVYWLACEHHGDREVAPDA